jgi:hypothetical protein
MTTTQAPVPLQPPPLQPANVDPAAAEALSATVLPLGKLAEQALPQAMPLGELDTVPTPVPDFVTLSGAVFAAALKTATTVAVPVTTHPPVPPQPPPLQPPNADPGSAEAVSVTRDPASNAKTQVDPHSRPPGEEVTVPVPEPWRCTMTLKAGETRTCTVTGGPPAMLTPLVLPESSFMLDASRAATAMVRLFPTGALTARGIS